MDLKKIKGVGEKTASLFSKLGINDTEDLVRYLPRTYESYKAVVPVSEVTPGQVCAVRAEITTEPVIRRKGHLSWISFVITDESGSLKVFYFNAPYLLNSFKKGYIRIFRGRITDGNGYRSMEQPVTYKESEYFAITGKMVPVYRTTKGLSSNTIMKTVKTALMLRAEADVRGDYLPEEIRERTGVMERGKAIYSVHFPESEKELAESRKRLLFDDMFLFTLSVRLERGTGEKKACDAPFIRVADTDRLMEKLPYELTDDQKKVWREIEDDMSSGYVMNRLVQGDVGSGKTVVALLSVLMCTANGRQAVLMAPTEVLAEQHMRNISEMVKKYDLSIRPVLLTGSLSASEKKKCRELLESGEADLAIGTHALFQEKVKFKNLCLAVTDEQHRFGVRQRVSLADKGDSTHVLVMSATPIPRTLAMIIYGDLSISVIKQMPSGRKPIKNAVIGTEQEMTTFKMIYKKVKEGRQAYVICPMIEEDDSGLASAEGCYERLVKIMPGDARVGLLHGRMDGKSKKKTMEDFAAGNLDILVSTTVIEVGVNVPNATVMMIENAERFGLSQLHQLRGRIGRGDEQSFCVFLNTSGSAAAKERLAVMQSTNDGFEIAQRDMEMRGPGDIFGDRQSGEPGEIYEELLSDPELLSLADSESSRLLSEDPDLSHHPSVGLELKHHGNRVFDRRSI